MKGFVRHVKLATKNVRLPKSVYIIGKMREILR